MPNPVSDPIWMTATDSLHINTASGVWLYFDSSLAQLEFHPHDCRLRTGDGWPNITALPESWHRLQMHRVTQGPLTPLAWAPAWPSGASRAGASHSSHPPACKTALCWDLQTGFTAPASTSSPPYRQQLSAAQDQAHGTWKHQCAVAVQNHDLGAGAEQAMFRISHVRLNRLSLCLFETKRNVRGKRSQATSHFVLCLFKANCWRGIDVLPVQACSCRNPHQSFLCQSMLGWKKSPGRSSEEQKMKALIWLMTSQWTLAL